MLSKEDVFDKAHAYDFSALKEYIEQGGETHIYDGVGNSILSALLDGYYSHVFASDLDEAKFLIEHVEDDEYYAHVNKYCRMPLEKRPHVIKQQVDYLIGKGIGINDVGWKEAKGYQKYAPCVETLLMQAVIRRDYCMTMYLLEHGANPGQQLFTDGNFEEYGYEDWLLEHLDVYILAGDYGDAMKLDLEIIALLMKYGLDQWAGGIRIKVDKENKAVQADGFKIMYGNA